MITPSLTFMVLILLSCGAFFIGRRRAFAVAGNRAGLIAMHSRPVYYGLLTALWCAVPALIIFAAWTIFESTIVTHLVVSALPEKIRSLPPDRLNLVVNDILEAFPPGKLPEKVSLRTDEELAPFLKEPWTEGWKSVYELPHVGPFPSISST